MEEKRVRLSEKDVGKSIVWDEVWHKYKPGIILGLIGLVLVSVGIFATLFYYQTSEPEIEIITGEEEAGTIWVDLAGAVEKAGVYELPADARVKDVLARAGGLSAEADREWVAKNMNLAQKLIDGVKLYIPNQSERVKEQESGRIAGDSASLVGKININTASAAQLDTLWGIGLARAADIIDNRPYQSAEELQTKKIIPSNVYERIKEKISVY